MEQKKITIKEQVQAAIDQKKPLKIIGGNSKAFLGRQVVGDSLDLSDYAGVISYEPTELYITVKAGTLLADVRKVLAEQNQMLAFEPPEVNENTTIGGVVASGLSGPRRPFTGSVRDYVLGIQCINGLAKELTFGGKVMKNVAGYDLSRLLTGSYGTLAIILEVTLKVLPVPEYELTGCKKVSRQKALEIMSGLFGQSVPVSAACYYNDQLFIRFSGNEKVVKHSVQEFDLENSESAEQLWRDLRDFKLPIFNSEKPVWRLSVPVNSNVDLKEDESVIDWAGAQYWFTSERPADELFAMAENIGGSAMLFCGDDKSESVFQPLSAPLFKIQKELKQAFDPHRILNREIMYKTI